MNPIEVPEMVQQKARARGAAGQEWLEALPGLLAELTREWGLRVGSTLHGGSESYVVTVRLGSGQPAVLKVGLPGAGGLTNEIRTLRAADGKGYVRLLEFDESRLLMLQERLGPSLRSAGGPVQPALERICTALQQAWEVAPPPELPTTSDKAVLLAGFITEVWEQLQQPCSPALIEQAVRFAEIRAAAGTSGEEVLVHGDAHDANALQDPAAPGRFKFVDPDGMRGDRAYDLGVLMREFNAGLLAGNTRQLCENRCAYLSSLAGVDPEPIWQWGFLERISTGLYALQIGAEMMGRQMLDVAGELTA